MSVIIFKRLLFCQNKLMLCCFGAQPNHGCSAGVSDLVVWGFWQLLECAVCLLGVLCVRGLSACLFFSVFRLPICLPVCLCLFTCLSASRRQDWAARRQDLLKLGKFRLPCRSTSELTSLQMVLARKVGARCRGWLPNLQTDWS